MSSETFLKDILGEPASLRTVADSYGDAASPLAALDEAWLRAPRILFVGMGSSFFAAHSCALALRAAGLDAHAELATTGLPQPAADDTLAVFVSASGGSRETVASFERHRGRSRTLAITLRPDAPLGAADAVLPLPGGPEEGGIACRSFQDSVAVMRLLAARLTGSPAGQVLDGLRRAADAKDALFTSREDWLPELADRLEGRPVYVAAPWERLASAQQAALMLREAPRIAADACETGDWSHVDVYLSRFPGYQLIVFGGSRWEPEMLDWMRRRERTLVSIGRPVDDQLAAQHIDFPDAGDDDVAALVETSAVELLACELWRRVEIGWR